MKLLRDEINHHKKQLKDLVPKHENLLSQLRNRVKWYDFYVINSKLKQLSSKESDQISKRHEKKLRNLLKNRSNQISFDPSKVIYNFTVRLLTENQKSALTKGLRYGLPPKNADETEVFAAFETCFSNLRELQINESQMTSERFKNKFAENAYSYCQNYSQKKERNLTDEELTGLNELKQDRSIVIMKADKGNAVVLLKKADYFDEMERMLQDTTKFRKLTVDPTIKREEKLTRYLRSLKSQGDITDAFYNKVRPCGSQPSRLYGLPKVHKANHPLRPICSSVNSHNYKLASELASILSPYAVSNYNVKDTFTFVREINELTFEQSHICSFDVSSLFTMIPLNESIDIALDYAFHENEKVHGLSRNQFKKLLQMSTKETNFLFNGNVFDQIDGVAMGSPLAPILANIFMRHFEENALATFTGMRPLFYRRYVDDCFIILKDSRDVNPFFNFLNSLHRNIKFTKEEEELDNEFFPFLDIKICRDGSKFLTKTYYKPTFTGVYTNWYSFTPRKYKINLVKCLFFRAWNICSNRTLFDEDSQFIIENLKKNQFPEKLLDAILRNFIEKMESTENENPPVTVERKEMLLILPFHGSVLSNRLRKNLQSLFSKAYPQTVLKIIFRTTFRVTNLFMLKDKIPKRFKSHVVYRVECTDCGSEYVGKTKRHMETRFKEHNDPRKPTAVTEHILRNNHHVSMDNVDFIARAKTDKELLIKESLLVKRLSPVLNNNVSSYPLNVF